MARDSYKVPELVYAPAKRGAANLLIMLAGTWGSGKTRSALELATGLAEGGPIFVGDTEHGRSLAYGDKFQFSHLDMKEPFRPKLFEAAAAAAQRGGAKVWICDNFSWEHIGPGGLLQWREAELQRLAGDDYDRRERMNMTSWIAPKAEHQAMLQVFWQLNCHILLAVQAKKKVEIVKNSRTGKMAPVDAGWQPVCGDDIPFAMSTALMFTPEKPGVPTIFKHNEFLDPLIPTDRQITADVGRALAAWARGDTVAPIARRAAPTDAYADAPPDYAQDPPDYASGEPGTAPVDPPDDEPAGPDPKMLAYIDLLEAEFLGTEDRQAHMKIVDRDRERIEWLKKNEKVLFNKRIKPAMDASWTRNDPDNQQSPPAEPPVDNAKEAATPETQELPL